MTLRKTEPINGDQMYNHFAAFLDTLVRHDAAERVNPPQHVLDDEAACLAEGIDREARGDERIPDAAIDLGTGGVFAFDAATMLRLEDFHSTLTGATGSFRLDAVPTFPSLPLTFCFPDGAVTINKLHDASERIHDHTAHMLKEGYGPVTDMLTIADMTVYVHEPFPFSFFARLVYLKTQIDGVDDVAICCLIGDGHVLRRGELTRFSNVESPTYSNPFGGRVPDPSAAYADLMTKLREAKPGDGHPFPLEEMCCIAAREHGLGLGHMVATASAFLEQPTHYIVQETPAHVAENPEKYARRAKIKIPRFADRERWIVIDIGSVKKIWPKQEHQGGTHASPVPHLRRGHTKVLSHERFKLMRGQILRIRPTWVGARDWSNGRAKYKVVSRVGAEADQA